MSYLTPDQAVAARESLNLSQSLVAKETGISRAYLSQFENSRRILEDYLLEAIHDCYVNHGWEPPEQVTEAPVEQMINDIDNGLTIMDGFVVSDYAEAEGYVLEELLDEYYENSQKIKQHLEKELKRGFFGGVDDDSALKSSIPPLLLMARQFEIKQILHGQYTANDAIDPEDSSTIQTVAHYLENLLMRAFPSRNPAHS